MSKRPHSAHHDEHADESWLIPYADLLTLLLALFIVLFASSSVDKTKYNAMKEAFYVALKGDIPEDANESEYFWPYPEVVVTELPDDIQINFPPPDQNPEESGGPLGTLYTSMKEYVHANALEDTVSVEYNGENVLITLKNDLWFESGSAQLTGDMQEKAIILATILKENQSKSNPFEIIIAGYTDDVPINTARYPSNLDLSLDRAAEFHRFLLKSSGLDPSYFSSRGYGEEHPIATNDTAEGRAKNRRVELLISQPLKQEGPEPAFSAASES